MGDGTILEANNESPAVLASKIFDKKVESWHFEVYSIGSRWKPGMSLGGDKRLGPQLQRRILAFLAGEASQEAVSGSLEKRLEAKGATTAGKLVVHAYLNLRK